MNRVINHALEHSKTVGGWFETESERYYFDSVKVFKNSEIDKAIEFAKENNQLAIYDMTNVKRLELSKGSPLAFSFFSKIEKVWKKNLLMVTEEWG